jgi:hypothetical protein
VIQLSGDFRDEYRRVGVIRIAEESGRPWFEEEAPATREISII